MKACRSILLLAATLWVGNLNAVDDTVEPIVSRIKRVAVESSALATVGYSKRLRALEIEFVNGAIYRYLEVPRAIHRQLMAARSKAQFYDENVRGRYRSIRVRPRRKRPRPER